MHLIASIEVILIQLKVSTENSSILISLGILNAYFTYEKFKINDKIYLLNQQNSLVTIIKQRCQY